MPLQFLSGIGLLLHFGSKDHDNPTILRFADDFGCDFGMKDAAVLNVAWLHGGWVAPVDGVAQRQDLTKSRHFFQHFVVYSKSLNPVGP